MTTAAYQFDRTPPAAAPGELTQLSPTIRRVIAPNPSPMTFTGTASYLVGSGSVALIDPGPLLPEHIDRILAALAPGESVEAVFVTHRHFDHSPGAQLIKEHTGAPCYAAPAPPVNFDGRQQAAEILAVEKGGGEGIDIEFVPDIDLRDGELVVSNVTNSAGEPAWSIRAVLTAGHLDDHMCFAVEAENALFTGDHVMGWSSSVLSPPEGDHGTYMRSLAALVDRSRSQIDRIYYPGHGNPVDAPTPLVQHLIDRRLKREQTILGLLAREAASLDELVRRLYPGVEGILTLAARRTLLAHLIDLAVRGMVAYSIPDSGSLHYSRVSD